MTIDEHELVGAYALDALSDQERRAFERHLDDCGHCRGEVDSFQATAALLGTAAADAPPPGMRDRVLAGVAATPQEAPTRRPVAQPAQAPAPASAPVHRLHDRRERLRQLLPAVAAVIVLGVAGVTVVVTQTSEPAVDGRLAATVAAPDARFVDLAAPDGTTARLVWSEAQGGGVLVTDGLPAAPDGHAYALWVIQAETPALLGMFQPDEHGQATHSIAGQPPAGLTVAVTVEVEDGVESPTTDPVIVGEL